MWNFVFVISEIALLAFLVYYGLLGKNNRK